MTNHYINTIYISEMTRNNKLDFLTVILFFNIYTYKALGYVPLKLNLDGKWQLSNSTMKSAIPAEVPGVVHTALMDSGILADPYYRDNDEKYRWVGYSKWTYSRNFTVSETIYQTGQVLLVCEGLDTISSVYINNKLVGQSDNMFVRYTFDIMSALQVGENLINIKFKSSIHYADKKANKTSYLIPRVCPPPEYHGECHGNMVRKTPCAFGWDMAPAFISAGIWRNIYIIASNSIIITDLTAHTERSDGSWVLSVGIHTRVQTKLTYNCVVVVKLDGTNIAFNESVIISSETPSINVEYKIPKTDRIQAWWPHSYGNQSLYNLTVHIIDMLDVVLSQKTVRFGFRTVDLVQNTVAASESKGRTFFFKINGLPIFLKGSNWVPSDSFPDRVTETRLRNYMQSAIDANMNCLRVWGGGNYEADYFYDLADELGILIWQDFMFAGSLYPVDEKFISSVTQEVKYQVRRLKRHPSVFCYAGNNEIEKGLNGGWWGPESPRYIADYVKLFMNTIHNTLREEDKTTPYLPSSPSNGILTILQGGLSNPGNSLYGDNHLYMYEKQFFNDFVYKTPRLATEYGFQSFPSMELLESVYDEHDLFYESELNHHRQHFIDGNTKMLDLVRMYMKLPNSTNQRKRFEDIIYCTQIIQAIAVRTETEHFRRWQSDVGTYGEGNTMGALYWMFADVWPSASWSSIEYGGKWKMLHYYARHFFAPVLISPYINFDKLSVFIVRDKISDLNSNPTKEGAWWPFDSILLKRLKNILQNSASEHGRKPSVLTDTLYVRVYSYESLHPRLIEQIHFQTHKAAELVYEISLTDLLERSECKSADNCFVVCYLNDILHAPVSWYPLGQFNDVSGLKIPNLRITSVEKTTDDKVFEIELSTEAVAPFVWLEAHRIQGRFSDNGFFMYTMTKSLFFYAWENVDKHALLNSLKVKSLLDVYV